MQVLSGIRELYGLRSATLASRVFGELKIRALTRMKQGKLQ
jgi:hypothetical protein